MSSYFPGHHGAAAMTTRWTRCETYFTFHTTASPVCMTVPMEPNSRECLHSSLALCPVTIRNYFHMFLWPVRSDSPTPVLALPGRPHRGRQLADQTPSSSAPQWKVSTLLTGQMSDPWQDGHPDSPAEILQTGSLPEEKKRSSCS